MSKILSAILLLAFITPVPITKLQGEPIQQAALTAEPDTYYKAIKGIYSAEIYKDELRAIARAKGLPEARIAEIEVVIGGNRINKTCPNGESGWNPESVGDNGTSFGLVQIHLPAHPGITEKQAKDPTFALNFIVDEFIKGNEWKWTCWKAVYKNG